MNAFASQTISEKVLLATARIQAALNIIPRIVGAKEDWALWMRDHLECELEQIPKPTTVSPHPRLLGSLWAMLSRHYRAGMTIETLALNEVRSDDPEITNTEYVDVPVGSLPELTGNEFWWHDLPPCIHFKCDTPPTAPLQVEMMNVERTSRNLRPLSTPAPRSVRLLLPPQSAISIDANKGEQSKAESGTSGKTPTSAHRKGKKRAAMNEPRNVPKKIRRMNEKAKSKEHMLADDDIVEAGPSTHHKGKGKDKDIPTNAVEDALASKICDVCMARRLQCVWDTSPGTQKQACQACQISKSRCKVKGLPFLRRLRGKAAKAAVTADSEDVAIDDFSKVLQDLLADMGERVRELETQVAESEQKKKDMRSKIEELEDKARGLKAKGKQS